MLECKINRTVRLRELFDDIDEEAIAEIRVTATAQELKLIDRALLDFAAAPLAYDMSEMVSEEDMLEMAAVCDRLRKELLA